MENNPVKNTDNNRAKNILVTGASGGLGLSVAKYFASCGCRVFACDVRKFPERNENVVPVVMDVRDMASVTSAFAKVRKAAGRLDAAVHLAGIFEMDSLVEIGEPEMVNIFNVNTLGVYRVNKVFLPLLSGGGRIVIVTSELATLRPLPFNGIYSITKSALDDYAHSLRLELALIGIPVITVRPGAFKTQLLNAAGRAMEKMCAKTALYRTSAAKFKAVMDSVTGKAMEPGVLAKIIYRAATSKRHKWIYSKNSNLLLKVADLLPVRAQLWVFRRLLTQVIKKKCRGMDDSGASY